MDFRKSEEIYFRPTVLTATNGLIGLGKSVFWRAQSTAPRRPLEQGGRVNRSKSQDLIRPTGKPEDGVVLASCAIAHWREDP
jgi:hypothetical protein